MFHIKKSSTTPPYFEAHPRQGATGAVNAMYGGNAVAASRISRKSGSDIINVCDSFDWSPTPYTNSGFDKMLIPYAEVNEYKLNSDAIARSLLYFASAATEAGAQTVGGLVGNGETTNVLNKVAEFFHTGTMQVLPVENSGDNLTASEWMKPYEGMYFLTGTGFKYLFPYFDNTAMNKIDSSYRDVTELADTLNNVARVSDGAAKIARIISPGQYVERPKLFDPAGSTLPAINISFPLLNTLSFDSAVRNYQLLWLLVFQNTPQRVTKSLIELPKLYEVTVPGVSNLKFSFMESLDIDFIGNRRRVSIQMPGGNGLPSSVFVTMPDAYNVRMTFRSLIMNSGNLMLEAWKKSAQNQL